jgi:type II protein arginine methyltransferase
MPLGQRAGDKGDSRFSGVEVLDFPAGDCLPAVLNQFLSSGFDFLLSPLVSTLAGPLLPAAHFVLTVSP